MHILLDRSGTPGGLSHLLATLDAQPDVEGHLVLCCDANGLTPEQARDSLASLRKPVFGGVFPQIVHDRERLERGSIVVGLPCAPRVAVIERASDPGLDLQARLASAFSPEDLAGSRSMFVFVDGFSTRIGALMGALFDTFGLDVPCIGGGCGSLSLKPGPCVIGPQGLSQDAAVIALLEMPASIGVSHGWEPISEAYKVTSSSGNTIAALDWRPAFDVYREVVEAHGGRAFGDDNFFDIAKAYPFGLARLGTEMVVRDPLMREGDALVCVGEVPQGAFVRVLHGQPDGLLSAARRAQDLAHRGLGARAPSAEIVVDCISRVLFLEDRFGLELDALRDPRLPMVGALSLGEIANSGQDCLDFYNKTAVVGLF